MLLKNNFQLQRLQENGGYCDHLEIKGHATQVLRIGAGKPIFLWIPAFGDPAANFISTLLSLNETLGNKLTLLAVDPPGFGGSMTDGKVLGFNETYHWAGELFDRLGSGKRPLLVSGNSSGASIAMGGALRTRSSVRGVISVCWPDWSFGKAPGSPELCPEDLSGLNSLLENSWHQPPVIPEAIALDLLKRLSNLEHRKHIDSFNPEIASQHFKKYRGPLAFIGGRSDGLVSPKVIQASAAARPGAILKWIEKCGHYPHREKRNELTQLLADLTGHFLNPIESGFSRVQTN